MITNQFNKYPHGFYFFNIEKLKQNYDAMSEAFSKRFSSFSIAYSYKTNYTPYLCKILKDKGAIAEVVSEMEMKLALTLGYEGKKIIYNGPFKSIESIKTALFNGVTIHVDSLDELKNIISVSDIVKPKTVNLGLRLNFEMKGEKRSRFGLDINSDELIKSIDLIDSHKFSLIGIHCHHPFRDLPSFQERMKRICSFCNKMGRQLKYIDLGGGFFSPMTNDLATSMGVKHVNYDQYADFMYQEFKNSWSLEYEPTLIIEPGSALVADVFDFYTRVVSIKKIENLKIATLTGSKFNILPNSKKTINLPLKVFKMNNSNSENEIEVYNLCGYTCIESDVMYEGFVGTLNKGDIIRFNNVGSYSVVMKPPFILPNYPILCDDNFGGFKEVKCSESYEYIFQNFNFNL